MHPFLSDLYSFRWQDAIDIALNSYILFRLYVLFRGTRIFQAMLSIAVFWVLQHIADYYGMLITGWVLRGSMALAAFVIVVVFRDEALSILQVKNLKSIFWSLPRPDVRTPIDIFTESVFDLAEKKTGALWVFPGKKSLEGIVRGGVVWEGLISREMLLSIFWNHNPVHDGAAVITNDRVTHVSAILPLSRREDIPNHFGTRHRAALGLSEVSDALCVVVSEERGHVTTAVNGRLDQIWDAAQLKESLRNHLGVARQTPGQLRRERLRGMVAAILSFVLVTATWIGFTTGVETLTTLDIPVEYTGRDDAYEIQYTSASNAQVQVGGSRPIIRSLRPEQIKVQVDLGRAAIGSNSYPLTVDNTKLPRGVTFKRIEPDQLIIELDRLLTKELPVQVDWTGRLPEKRIVTEVTLSPETINVTGGTHAFADVTTLYTEKVPLEGTTASGEFETEVVLPPGISSIPRDERPRVTVQYRVEQRNPE